MWAFNNWTRCPDVIVAIDGNFQHRRFKHILQDPKLSTEGDDFFWIPQEDVLAAKNHIETSKKSNATNPARQSKDIPSQVLDNCADSYKASQERLHEHDDQLYDEKGIMALVCAHDIPLFLASITTKGEARFYGVALLRALAKEIPVHGTLGVMYDIADQFDRTIEKAYSPIISHHCTFSCFLFYSTTSCQSWHRGALLPWLFSMPLDTKCRAKLSTIQE